MFPLLVCVLLVQAALPSGAIQCGSAPPKVQEKVSHGDVTAEGRWPWAVAIYYTGSSQPSGFWCTGSLISNHYVLNVQHCTMESNDTGSPLMTYVKSENKWYQIGVDRGGCEDQDSCGQHGEVFGRLTAFCKWIEETTGGEAKCSGPE